MKREAELERMKECSFQPNHNKYTGGAGYNRNTEEVSDIS